MLFGSSSSGSSIPAALSQWRFERLGYSSHLCPSLNHRRGHSLTSSRAPTPTGTMKISCNFSEPLPLRFAPAARRSRAAATESGWRPTSIKAPSATSPANSSKRGPEAVSNTGGGRSGRLRRCRGVSLEYTVSPASSRRTVVVSFRSFSRGALRLPADSTERNPGARVSNVLPGATSSRELAKAASTSGWRVTVLDVAG